MRVQFPKAPPVQIFAAQMSRFKFPYFEFKGYKASQVSMVKEQIYIEVFISYLYMILLTYEGKSNTQLKYKQLQRAYECML